jgi:hypothetical protein
MNIPAKITLITVPNTVTIGDNIYTALHPQLKTEFKEIKFSIEHWKYRNRQTGQVYKLYASKNVA